jgi:hypothetical protein
MSLATSAAGRGRPEVIGARQNDAIDPEGTCAARDVESVPDAACRFRGTPPGAIVHQSEEQLLGEDFK